MGETAKDETKEFINWLERKYKGLLKDFQLVGWIQNANLLTWGPNGKVVIMEGLPSIVSSSTIWEFIRNANFGVPSPWIRTCRGLVLYTLTSCPGDSDA